MYDVRFLIFVISLLGMERLIPLISFASRKFEQYTYFTSQSSVIHETF